MANSGNDRFDDPDDEKNTTGWSTVDEEELTPYDVDEDENRPFHSVADSPTGYILEDTDAEDTTRKQAPLTLEETDDFITIGTDADAVMDQIDDFTEDPDILADFAERQQWTNGSDELYARLRKHHSKKPDLSAGDLDAAWEDSDVSGDESVGGSVSTPDQDVVEELGEAVGIIYSYDEELHTADMLNERDENRWELDPASTEDDWDEDEEGTGRDEL